MKESKQQMVCPLQRHGEKKKCKGLSTRQQMQGKPMIPDVSSLAPKLSVDRRILFGGWVKLGARHQEPLALLAGTSLVHLLPELL